MKTVFWPLKIAAFDFAQFSNWGIIFVLIFFKLSTMVGLITHAIKSLINAK